MTLCELKWLHPLLIDLRDPVHHSIPFHCDSQAVIHIVANPIFHECIKRIEFDFHFIHAADILGTS